MIRVGCCGFPVPRARYREEFSLVEVQQTFYQPPRLETARRWREEVPPGFEFTLKAWQLITHPASSPTYRRTPLAIPEEEKGAYGLFQPTPQVWEAWHRTEEVARALRARAVVFQCPPSFQPSPQNIDNLQGFFQAIRDCGFVLVWEPRGSWEPSLVERLCRDLDLVHGVDPMEQEPLWGRPRYFRLHGGKGYRHVYTDEELAALIRRWRDEEAYFLFNNLSMYRDAARFKELLAVG